MKKGEAPNQAAVTETAPDTFSKEAILKSKRWANRRDALSFLLKDGEEYSHEDVMNILNDYMKGQVK
jgi:hypothetical protein